MCVPLPAAADGPLALAASKASVGHAEAGAGLVGFAAAVLSVEERALPRLLHLRWGRGPENGCLGHVWLSFLGAGHRGPSPAANSCVCVCVCSYGVCYCSRMNPYVQQSLNTACKQAADGPIAVTAPRAAAALPVAAAHGRLAAGISAFAFQVGHGKQAEGTLDMLGSTLVLERSTAVCCRPDCLPASPYPAPLQGTNAHAMVEMLDQGQMQSLFDRADTAPAWQRTTFWLLPPASALLQRGSVGRAAAGEPVRVLLQGRLDSPAVAALLHSAAACGGSWALAAEAAYAAAVIMAAVYDGKQQRLLGLAAAAVSPAGAASLAGAVLLTAAVDARRGSVAVAAGSSQLLTAAIVTAAESAVPACTKQPAQPAAPAISLCLAACESHLDAALADMAAESAWQAQQHHGLFLQPALLQASTQLQQLAGDVSAAAPGAASQQQRSQLGAPAAFEFLLPGRPEHGPGSSSGSKQQGTDSRLWKASACRSSLRLCSSNGSGLFLSGMQQIQRAAAENRAASADAASTSATTSDSVSYTAVWQALQPAGSMATSPAKPGKQATALFTVGSSPRRGSRRKTRLRGKAFTCRLPQPGGTALGAGQAACFGAMQLLQSAVAKGESLISLTATAPGAAGALAPCSHATSSVTATRNAALLAMLRCASSELPAVRLTAGGMDEATPAAAGASETAVQQAWDAAFSCHGQQLSAGTHLAARLLPVAAAAAEKPLQQTPMGEGQEWALSGGTGALGLLAAGWLQQQQAAGLLLLGRTGRLSAPAPTLLLQGVQAAACCLTLRMCDAAMQADSAAAAAAVAADAASPLAGFLHAGGVLHDAGLQQQTPATIRAVHAPKAAGLHQLLAATALAAPVQQALLFSSIAAVTGPAGSMNYAAANAALDAAASNLQLQGGRCCSGCGCQPLVLPTPAADACLSSSPSPCLALPTSCVQACPAAACSGAPGPPLEWWQTMQLCTAPCSAQALACWTPARAWRPCSRCWARRQGRQWPSWRPSRLCGSASCSSSAMLPLSFMASTSWRRCSTGPSWRC